MGKTLQFTCVQHFPAHAASNFQQQQQKTRSKYRLTVTGGNGLVLASRLTKLYFYNNPIL